MITPMDRFSVYAAELILFTSGGAMLGPLVTPIKAYYVYKSTINNRNP